MKNCKQKGVCMIVEKSEYRGKPIIIIKKTAEDRFPFSFGLTKARMIVESIDEIKKFVEENEGKE